MDALGKRVRRRILEMAHRAGRGHVGGGLSAVEILLAVYGERREGDVVVVGKGHAGEAVYVVLGECGVLEEKELESFGADGTRLGDHISRGVPGVVLGAGSLGHGLGVACGIAMGKELKGERGVVWCVVGDGEMMEGSCWEAVLFAGERRLGNLVVVVDRNFLMTLEEPPVGDLGTKFEVFGWERVECDGNDASDLSGILAHLGGRRPKVVIAHTVKGAGVNFMEGDPRWHHGVPNEEEYRKAMEELR